MKYKGYDGKVVKENRRWRYDQLEKKNAEQE